MIQRYDLPLTVWVYGSTARIRKGPADVITGRQIREVRELLGSMLVRSQGKREIHVATSISQRPSRTDSGCDRGHSGAMSGSIADQCASTSTRSTAAGAPAYLTSRSRGSIARSRTRKPVGRKSCVLFRCLMKRASFRAVGHPARSEEACRRLKEFLTTPRNTKTSPSRGSRFAGKPSARIHRRPSFIDVESRAQEFSCSANRYNLTLLFP